MIKTFYLTNLTWYGHTVNGSNESTWAIKLKVMKVSWVKGQCHVVTGTKYDEDILKSRGCVSLSLLSYEL